jgi:hypothetical protein
MPNSKSRTVRRFASRSRRASLPASPNFKDTRTTPNAATPRVRFKEETNRVTYCFLSADRKTRRCAIFND